MLWTLKVCAVCDHALGRRRSEGDAHVLTEILNVAEYGQLPSQIQGLDTLCVRESSCLHGVKLIL